MATITKKDLTAAISKLSEKHGVKYHLRGQYSGCRVVKMVDGKEVDYISTATIGAKFISKNELFNLIQGA